MSRPLDYYLKAERARLAYSWATHGANDAFTLYDKALSLDPDFVDAHIGNARAGMDVWRFSRQFATSTLRARDRAQSALAAALAIDSDNAEALVLQARMQLYLLNHELALSLARGAVLRHPMGPEARVTLGFVLMASERPDEAREAYASALALASKPSPELLLDAGEGYLLLDEAEKAAALLERARNGGISGLVTAMDLAAAYARLGHMEKARAELERVRRVWPWLSVAWYRVTLAHVRNGQRVAQNFLDPLLKAGMSEWPYGFVGRPEDRLHDADLKVLFRGSPREEISGGSGPGAYSYLHDGDGDWRAVVPSNRSIVLFSGTNAIKGNMLCLRSETRQMGREYCNAVYRNPDGSPETKDEYLRVNLRGLWRFSIKPLERD